MVIQPHDGALEGYRQALAMLVDRDAIRGARIGLYANGSSAPTVRLVTSFGVEVLGIIDDADLFEPDVEAVFNRYAAMYPQVRVFQVGNEITTSAVSPMPIDRYLDVLERMYVHVVGHYPGVTLVSQATFGSGTIGAGDLAAMAPRLETHGFSPRRLIVGINIYTERAFTAYADELALDLTNYRIWVTETGSSDESQQMSYVETTYPRLRTSLRAERIYWYALWAGDVGGDSESSLIHAPTNPPIVPGPLFRLLTEAG